MTEENREEPTVESPSPSDELSYRIRLQFRALSDDDQLELLCLILEDMAELHRKKGVYVGSTYMRELLPAVYIKKYTKHTNSVGRKTDAFSVQSFTKLEGNFGNNLSYQTIKKIPENKQNIKRTLSNPIKEILDSD